jgi:2-polyprenyl-3-methyl-5-hydroxy-6-metoxy-1,4-benzoquinol methylase
MEKKSVENVYDDYPYPERNPEDEKKSLMQSHFTHVNFINNVFWAGKKDFANFRALDAGCGTGDCVIHLAEQLKDTKAEIVALDISQKSIDVAKKRAEVRGLKNIKFVCGSLMDLPKLGLGKFDYIVSTSVLPHLDNPEEGLKLLAESLNEDGGMGLKVYGKYGRMPITIMQELWNMVNSKEKDTEKKVENAKEVFEAIPAYHWYRFVKRYDDMKYDAVLSANTVSYTVPQIYDFIDAAGLKMSRFYDTLQYDPIFYTKGKMKEKIDAMDGSEKHALAELLNSTMASHEFFVTKKDYSAPEVDESDENMVPSYAFGKPDLSNLEGEAIELKIKRRYYGSKMRIDKRFVKALDLIDGKRTVKDIVDALKKENPDSQEEVMKGWNNFFNAMKQLNLIVLNLPR